MGGCGATCGITVEREREMLSARAVAERVRAASLRARPPRSRGHTVSYDELSDLGRRLEAILPIRAVVHVGEPGACDSLFLLAGLHRPCLQEILEAGVAHARDRLPLTETYVRVAVSPHGRFAVLQEVLISSEPTDDGVLIACEPQAGVVDRRLQHIVKGLQGALRRARLIVLDLGATLTPLDPVVAAGCELADPSREAASLWRVLFEPTSALAARASLLQWAELRADEGGA